MSSQSKPASAVSSTAPSGIKDRHPHARTTSILSSTTTSAVRGADRHPTSGSRDALKRLLDSVHILAASDCYRELTGLFNESAKLEGRIKSKENELERLNAEIKDLRKRHNVAFEHVFQTHKLKEGEIGRENSTLKDNAKALRDELQKAEKALAEEKSKEETTQKELERVQGLLTEEQAKTEEMEGKNKELNTTLEGQKEEIGQLKGNLDEETGKAKNLGEELEKVKDEHSSATSELETSKAKIEELEATVDRLKKLEGFAITHPDEDEEELLRQVTKIWPAAMKMISGLFKDDLSEECLQDRDAWLKLKEPRILNHRVPLPVSNSPAAKQMRTAVMLAIFSRVVDKWLFQPNYLFSEEDLRKVLVDEAIKDSEKESYSRALLLSMEPEKQSKSAAARIDRVVTDMEWFVTGFVCEKKLNKFKSQVRQVAQVACKGWMEIQKARKRYEPEFAPWERGDMQSELVRFDGDEDPETSKTTEAGPEEYMLVVFPCIFLIEDNAAEPMNYATVLAKEQVAEAAREAEQQILEPGSPMFLKTQAQRKVQRQRTMSMHLSDTLLKDSSVMSE
ncbi:hypothetical protein BDY21DRAFT_346711 [Lineolata rhizophorae]|uniref:Uncharacterized protein n=1 Tax=Lineolata rhizophorae TaxID=578093 RepID=A0A6A6NZP4_9PEZI|nr:hypothetical protein BDY21DRAFT_346711 [Lineolata rhizophorae]